MPDNEPTLFSAILTPNRSLTRAGFVVLTIAIGGTGVLASVAFLVTGAWPVSGFLGLDVLLIWWAFRASYRAAAAFEQVRITPSELNVRKVSERGELTEWTLNPVCVRLDRDIDEEFGVERLFLVAHGHKLPIATLLGPQEKQNFAAALADAIGKAKRGPNRTTFERPDGNRVEGTRLPA